MKVYALLITETGENGNYTDCLIFDTRQKASDKMQELYNEDYNNADEEESYCTDTNAFVLLDNKDITYEVVEKEIK